MWFLVTATFTDGSTIRKHTSCRVLARRWFQSLGRDIQVIELNIEPVIEF